MFVAARVSFPLAFLLMMVFGWSYIGAGCEEITLIYTRRIVDEVIEIYALLHLLNLKQFFRHSCIYSSIRIAPH